MTLGWEPCLPTGGMFKFATSFEFVEEYTNLPIEVFAHRCIVLANLLVLGVTELVLAIHRRHPSTPSGPFHLNGNIYWIVGRHPVHLHEPRPISWSLIEQLQSVARDPIIAVCDLGQRRRTYVVIVTLSHSALQIIQMCFEKPLGCKEGKIWISRAIII